MGPLSHPYVVCDPEHAARILGRCGSTSSPLMIAALYAGAGFIFVGEMCFTAVAANFIPINHGEAKKVQDTDTSESPTR